MKQKPQIFTGSSFWNGKVYFFYLLYMNIFKVCIFKALETYDDDDDDEHL